MPLARASGRAGGAVRRPPVREESFDDFFLELPDVGQFRYGRRTIGDRLAIRRDYLRYTQEFGDTDEDLSLYAALIATHAVLCVQAPDGWDNLATIPAHQLDKVFELGALVRGKEEALAKGADKSGSPEGARLGGDDGVAVEGALSAAADGSALSVDDARGHAG
jgi:hypothetical protein